MTLIRSAIRYPKIVAEPLDLEPVLTGQSDAGKDAEVKGDAKVKDVDNTHGSSSGNPKTKFYRYEDHLRTIEIKDGDVFVETTDLNVDKTLPAVMNRSHSIHAAAGFAVQEEKDPRRARRKQGAINYKERTVDVSRNLQFEKAGIPVSGDKDFNKNITTIALENAPCMLVRFAVNPMDDMSRQDHLILTKGKPTYGIYFDEETKEEMLVYVTDIGLPVEISCINTKELGKDQSQDPYVKMVREVVKLRDRFPKEAVPQLQNADNNFLAAMKTATGHVPTKSAFLLKDVLEDERLGKVRNDLQNDMEALTDKSVAAKSRLIRSNPKYRNDVRNYYDIKNRVKDHNFKRSVRTIVETTPDGTTKTRERTTVSLNSMKVGTIGFKRDHYKRTSDQNIIDIKILNNAFGALVINETMKILLQRECFNTLGKRYDSYEKLVLESTPEEKDQIVQHFAKLIEKNYPTLREEQLGNLIENFKDLLTPNSHLFNDVTPYNSTLVGAFNCPTHYFKVLDIYQKLINVDARFDQLTENDVDKVFKLVDLPIYKLIENEVVNPIQDPYKRLYSLIDPKVAPNTDADPKNHNMNKHLRRALIKLPNMMLGKQDLTAGNIPGIGMTQYSDGMEDLTDENDRVYAKEELKEFQLDDIYAYLYHAHLIEGITNELYVAPIEIKAQPEKAAAINKVLAIINNFVLSPKPSADAAKAYFELMKDWETKYTSDVDKQVQFESRPDSVLQAKTFAFQENKALTEDRGIVAAAQDEIRQAALRHNLKWNKPATILVNIDWANVPAEVETKEAVVAKAATTSSATISTTLAAAASASPSPVATVVAPLSTSPVVTSSTADASSSTSTVSVSAVSAFKRPASPSAQQEKAKVPPPPPAPTRSMSGSRT